MICGIATHRLQAYLTWDPLQIGRKRGRGEEGSGKAGARGPLGGEPSGSGSLLSSQDSLSLAASQGVQRFLEPELDRVSMLSEDATSESIDGRSRMGTTGSRALPESDASSTSSLAGREGGRIRLMLSFDGSQAKVADAGGPGGGFAPGHGLAPAEKHSAAQHGSSMASEAAADPGGTTSGAGSADEPTGTTDKPGDTARRKAAAGDGIGPEQESVVSAVDGIVLENGAKLGRQHSHAHLDGVAFPDGVDGVTGLHGKKRALGKLVDVHASAEDRSAAGRKAAGEDGAGDAAAKTLLQMAMPVCHDIRCEVHLKSCAGHHEHHPRSCASLHMEQQNVNLAL